MAINVRPAYPTARRGNAAGVNGVRVCNRGNGVNSGNPPQKNAKQTRVHSSNRVGNGCACGRVAWSTQTRYVQSRVVVNASRQ